MDIANWNSWNASLRRNVVLVHAPRMLLKNTRNVHLDVFGTVMTYLGWSRRVVDVNNTLRELCRPNCLLTESCIVSNGQFVSTFAVLQ
ncbi:hypothetical protein EG68_08707 [Paragonimus skrjabini miyazakii]|uniref:Uncharacterized protein n=1 Tax=Paragonimus skrjabini miyazakii TaxID=59628 RepID=A0A8S9YIC7_9TREM|nr:hypothetical protein EG68_08707 [Paragonimus skrjabini miyazakii]